MAVGDTDTDPEGSRVLFAEIVRMHSNACPGIHHARRETLSPGQPHYSVPFCQKALPTADCRISIRAGHMKLCA